MVKKAGTLDLKKLLSQVKSDDTSDSTTDNTTVSVSINGDTGTNFIPTDSTDTGNNTAAAIDLTPKRKPRLRQQSYYLTESTISNLARLSKASSRPKSDLVEAALQLLFTQPAAAALLKKDK